jgi:hypothetical protein
MLRKPKEDQRDEQSFHSLLVDLRGFFVTDDPLRGIYKKLYLKGADLRYVDSLVRCLRAIDSTHDMCQELGAKRRGFRTVPPQTADPALRLAYDLGARGNITKGELRKTWTGLSYFAADCLNGGVVDESEAARRIGRLVIVGTVDRAQQSFTPRQKEDIGGFLLEAYSSNPQDSRSGGKSDSCGSFFLLLITEHFKEKKIKPRDSLAATLLRNTRRQQSAPASQERINVKVRVHEFKLRTPDWRSRLRQFTEKLRYLSTT